MSDITVCYAVTPDLPYPRFAAASLYSLHRSNPGVEVRLAEVHYDGDYPWGVMPAAIPDEADRSGWVVILDADTWINGDLHGLLPDPDRGDISLRMANAWLKGLVNHNGWWAICDHCKLPRVPICANGVIACSFRHAAVLKRHLPIWMRTIPRLGLPDPCRLRRSKHGRRRPDWWMRDQYALAAIVGDQRWAVRVLGSEEFSLNYCKESGGIVHHLGKTDNPFEERRWPIYQSQKT